MRHLRELSQAAAGLAHETRNPLGLIRGWTQRLAQAAMPEAERQKHTSALIEECDRVTARINQFLAFARPRDPEIESIDIRNMVEEMAMIMQPDLESRQLQLVGHVAPSAGGLKADRELLRQLIFNLLQNAVQFAPAGSTIDLTVEFKSDRLAVPAGGGPRSRSRCRCDRIAIHALLHNSTERNWAGVGHRTSHCHPP